MLHTANHTKHNSTSQSSMSTLKIVCFVSSVRNGRMADRMKKLVQSQFNEFLTPKGHTLQFVDPEEFDLPVLKQPLHFYTDPTQAPEVLHKLNEIVLGADAYLILTAEYNRSLPPPLTNLMDHLPPSSYEFKSSGLIAYSQGNLGGAMAVSAARPFLSELGCLPVKQFVTIPFVNKEIKEDGTTENDQIYSSLKKCLNEVEWWACAAKHQMESQGKPNQK